MKKIGKIILSIIVLVFAFFYYKDKFETSWGSLGNNSLQLQHTSTQESQQTQILPSTAGTSSTQIMQSSFQDFERDYQSEYDLLEGFVREIYSSLEVMSDGVPRVVMLQKFTKHKVEMRQVRIEAIANGVHIHQSAYENISAPDAL